MKSIKMLKILVLVLGLVNNALTGEKIQDFAQVGEENPYASNPVPANGATVILRINENTILRWDPGGTAASHNVYFGTDEDAVRNATTFSTEYKGNKTLGFESVEPGKLACSTTYYWRIDEVNNFNPDSPWKGPVWGIRTDDFSIVDDFERYNSSDNLIWNTWKEGFGYDTLGEPNYNLGNGIGWKVSLETENVHSDKQSLRIDCNNTGADEKLNYLEVSRTFDPLLNLSNAAELSLWFKGDQSNDTVQFYIALQDVDGNRAFVNLPDVNLPDDSTAQKESWEEFKARIDQFKDQGADLTNVNGCAIGCLFAEETEAGACAACGSILVDDIQFKWLPSWEPNDPCPYSPIGESILGSNVPMCDYYGQHPLENCLPACDGGPCGVPDKPQDIWGIYNFLLDFSQPAVDRISGLFPCVDGPNDVLVGCASSDLLQSVGDVSLFVQSEPLLAGRYVLLIVQFGEDIPLNDDTHYYQYAFVFDADGLASNNYEPWPDFPNDFFSYTDKWYELTYSPDFGWELFVTDVRNDFAQIRSDARFIITGSEMAILVPLDEFDIDTPTFRATAFRHTGDFGMFGGPWSGDLSSLIGEPLLSIAGAESVIVIEE